MRNNNKRISVFVASVLVGLFVVGNASALVISGSTSPSSSGGSSSSYSGSSSSRSSGTVVIGGSSSPSSGSSSVLVGGPVGGSTSGGNSYSGSATSRVVIGGTTGYSTNTNGSTRTTGTFSCPTCPTSGAVYDTMDVYSDGTVILGATSRMAGGSDFGSSDPSIVIIAGQAPSGSTSSGGSSYTPTPVQYSVVSFASTPTIKVGGTVAALGSTVEVESGKTYNVDFSHLISPTGHTVNANYTNVVTTVQDVTVEQKTISGTSYNGATSVAIGKNESKKVCQTVGYTPYQIKISDSTGEESVYSSTVKTSEACVTLKAIPVPEPVAKSTAYYLGEEKISKNNLYEYPSSFLNDYTGGITAEAITSGNKDFNLTDAMFAHVIYEGAHGNSGSFIWRVFDKVETYLDGVLVGTEMIDCSDYFAHYSDVCSDVRRVPVDATPTARTCSYSDSSKTGCSEELFTQIPKLEIPEGSTEATHVLCQYAYFKDGGAGIAYTYPAKNKSGVCLKFKIDRDEYAINTTVE